MALTRASQLWEVNRTLRYLRHERSALQTCLVPSERTPPTSVDGPRRRVGLRQRHCYRDCHLMGAQSPYRQILLLLSLTGRGCHAR